MTENKNINHALPSSKSVQDAIVRVEDFREACRWGLEQGLWATIDFPSKHHINKILTLQYKNKKDILDFYGPGLTDRALKVLPYCKAYVQFTREINE